jgi:protein-S-isoprenylcysteine O-methyltransferase Ste14
MENKEEKGNIEERGGMVHFILLHSYMVFLFAVVLGALFDTFLKKPLFSDDVYPNLGFCMIIIGSVLIYWAQKTSSNSRKKTQKDNSKAYFASGPYRYLRSPTHLGLFIMTLGLGFLINSFFSVVFTIIAYFITKWVFLKKEEKVLERKYGQVYRDYKKKVRNWI